MPLCRRLNSSQAGETISTYTSADPGSETYHSDDLDYIRNITSSWINPRHRPLITSLLEKNDGIHQHENSTLFPENHSGKDSYPASGSGYLNGSFWNSYNSTDPPEGTGLGLDLDKVPFIKAVVLAVVLTLLIISTCRLVFKTFSRYGSPGKKDDQ